jgi:hypothetical protein
VRRLLLCAALLFPIICVGQETCEEKAARIQRAQSRPLAELTTTDAITNGEQYLNLAMECILWDFDTYPKLRALLPPERPTVVAEMVGSLRTPYVAEDKIIFPFEYYGYLTLVGMLVGHDAYAQDNYFPLEKTLMNTPYRMGEVTPLMDPLSDYLSVSAFSSLKEVLMCDIRERNCQTVLQNSVLAIDLFSLLHELSHLALHHAIGHEGVNVSDEIAADKRAFKALRIIAAGTSDKDPDIQKECRLTYVLAPLAWLHSEASRTPNENSLAAQRLQALLGVLDETTRETVESIIKPENSKHNLRKVTLSWEKTPEHLFIDGIRVSPADVLGKELILSAQPHVILGLRSESLAVAQINSYSEARIVMLVFQPFENSSLSELESLQAARKPIDMLVRTTDGNLQPRSRNVAFDHWKALHLLHLDSLIEIADWTDFPSAETAELKRWQQDGRFLSSW